MISSIIELFSIDFFTYVLWTEFIWADFVERNLFYAKLDLSEVMWTYSEKKGWTEQGLSYTWDTRKAWLKRGRGK